MDPIKSSEQVGAELERRLALIRKGVAAPGETTPFETDIGAKVFQGRRHIDATMLPCVSVVEADDVVQRQNVLTTYQIGQKFALISYVQCDVDRPNVAAHAALRDMMRVVFRQAGKASKYLAERTNEITYLGKQIAPREDGQAFVCAILEIEVGFDLNVSEV